MPCELETFDIAMEGETCVVQTPKVLASIEWHLIEPIFDELVSEFPSTSPPRVIVDLELVQSFSASFLSLLLRIWKHVELREGRMILCNVSDSAETLLRITALDSTWRRYPDRKAALQALEEK